MKSLLKILLSLVALLVLIAVGLGFYIATYDLNEHKDMIADKVRDQTGRDLTISGTIEHSLYPWLGLKASGITLSEDPAFGDTPFLTAGLVEFRIKLLPLLSGKYEIDTITLHDTRANLITAADGSTNWASLTQGQSSDSADRESGEAGLPQLIIGGIDIQNLNISVRDESSGSQTTLENLNFTTDELILGEPLALQMNGAVLVSGADVRADFDVASTLTYDLSGQAYELSPLHVEALLAGPEVPGGSAPLTANTTLSVNLEEETLELTDLIISLLNTEITANLNGERIQSDPALSGALNIEGSDLTQVLRALGQQNLAEEVEATGDRSVNVSTAFSYDAGSGNLSIPELTAYLLGADIKADINARGLNSESPDLSGTISANGPDLPALLQLAGRIQGGDSSLLVYGRQLSTYPGAKRFQLESEFMASPDAGNIDLPALKFEALGLALEGTLAASNMDSSTGSADGNFSLRGNNLKPLLRALEQTELAQTLDSLELKLKVGGNRQSLALQPLSLDLNFSGTEVPGGSATLELNADSTINLEQDTANISNFSISGLGLNLQGNITASGISDNPEVNGSLNLPAFNLRTFLESIGQEVPATRDENVLQHVALSSSFSFADNLFSLNDLNAELDESTLSGNFSAGTESASPIRFDLALDSINVDRYLAPASEATGAESGSAGELPMDMLRKLDVNGSVSAGTVIASGLTLNDITASFLASNGTLSLSPLQANLYEGSYAGDIVLDVSTDIPAATLDTRLVDVNLEPLMIDYMGSAMVSGHGNVSLSVRGRGNSTATIGVSLAGQGSIDLQEGTLTGVDVDNVLRQVETMIRNRRMAEINRGEQTAFDAFSASFLINQGVVTSEDLLIESPGFNVAGRGTLIDLRNETIAFNLTATVDETTVTNETEEYDLGGYSLPIACTGQVVSPRCLPDLAQIARSAFANEVRDRIGGLLQRTLGGDEATPAQDGTTEISQPLPETDLLEEEQTEEEVDPREQLLNEALDRIFF